MIFQVPWFLSNGAGAGYQLPAPAVEVSPTDPGYSGGALTFSQEPPNTMLGTPWVGQVEFQAVSDWSGRSFSGMMLPPATVTDISLRRNIITTRIAGRNGTVKELISAEDYVIRVRGIATNPQSMDAPIEFINQIHNLLQLQASVPVVSQFLQAASISYLVIEQATVSEIQGTPNAVQFEISALADNAPEITLLAKEGGTL